MIFCFFVNSFALRTIYGFSIAKKRAFVKIFNYTEANVKLLAV